MKRGDSVEIESFDDQLVFDASEWPSGQEILDMLQARRVETFHGPEYWQVCARWALLNKYKLLTGSDLLEELAHKKTTAIVLNGDTVRHYHFDEPEIRAVQNRWQECLVNLHNSTVDTLHNDFYELLTTKRSNGRLLKWATMRCPPGCQFKLHAHPNIELIHCAQGALHEVRMEGEPLTRSFEKVDESSVKGPDLSTLSRPWHFSTLLQGDWLVNEVGSIHKSFTASKGDGCMLIVLWGGSHADVPAGQEPASIDVQQTVDKMDEALGVCDCTKWDTMEETFLPESERAGN
jgi:hypothetical protein